LSKSPTNQAADLIHWLATQCHAIGHALRQPAELQKLLVQLPKGQQPFAQYRPDNPATPGQLAQALISILFIEQWLVETSNSAHKLQKLSFASPYFEILQDPNLAIHTPCKDIKKKLKRRRDGSSHTRRA